MKPLTEKQAARWKKTRRMGRWRYTLIYGVLLWGIPVAILWSVAMAWTQGWGMLPNLLKLSLIGFPIGGVLYGRLMWWIFETRYEAAMRGKTRSAARRG